nr:gluconokinase [Streptomyces sp. TLI_235]
MGVSGAGKSTVGGRLAHRLGVPFTEGDDLHPQANIARMTAGSALGDADRGPWLDAVADVIRQTSLTPTGGVISCSALKRRYRDILRAAGPGVFFLHLALTPAEARARLSRRHGHFMPSALLGSQYQALEPLQADEPGVTLDADGDPETILRQAEAAIARFEDPDGR